jgi:hypothetical protein
VETRYSFQCHETGLKTSSGGSALAAPLDFRDAEIGPDWKTGSPAITAVNQEAEAFVLPFHNALAGALCEKWGQRVFAC